MGENPFGDHGVVLGEGPDGEVFSVSVDGDTFVPEAKLNTYREALGDLTDAAKEYRRIVAGWFDFTDTDAYDELNAALVHADRELAARQALEEQSE